MQRNSGKLQREVRSEDDGAWVLSCSTCGEKLGLSYNGQLFVACHECNYPICRHCVDYEIKEGRNACMQCGAPCNNDDKEATDIGEKESGNRMKTASCLDTVQDTGIHARNISTVSTVDCEYIDDTGNPIWKNRVESWKDKKNKKKQHATKEKTEAQIPSEQQMEEKPQSIDASQPLSRVVPLPKSQLTPYRIVITMRLIILALFFNY